MPFMPGPIKEKFQADDFDSLSEGIALHDAGLSIRFEAGVCPYNSRRR